MDWTRLKATATGVEDAWKDWLLSQPMLQPPPPEGEAPNYPVGETGGKLWDAIKATGGIASEAATQAVSGFESKQGGAVTDLAKAALPPPPPGESAWTPEEMRGQTAVDVPGVDLPPLPDNPDLRAHLQTIYGPEGEHWGESPNPEVAATPEGSERLRILAEMAKHDPSYNDPNNPESPYQKWKQRFGSLDPATGKYEVTDPHQQDAFAQTVLSEYKQSRKKDASINPSTIAGQFAGVETTNKLLGVAFETPAVIQAVRKGVPLAEAIKTAMLEGSPEALARDALRWGGAVAPTALAGPFKVAPKLASATVGSGIGAYLAGPDNRVEGALTGAGAGLVAGAAGEKVVPALSKLLTNTAVAKAGRIISNAAGDVLAENPNRWEKLLGPSGYKGAGALYSGAVNAAIGATDENDPMAHAVINGAIGLALPVTMAKLTDVSIPGLRAFGTKLSTPVFGAMAGALAGPSVRHLVGIEDPTDNVLGNAAYDSLAGAAAFTGIKGLGVGGIKLLQAAGKLPEVNPSFLAYARTGDLTDPVAVAAQVIPTDRLRSVVNPVKGTMMMNEPLSGAQARWEGWQDDRLAWRARRDQEFAQIFPGENPAQRAKVKPLVESLGRGGSPIDTPEAKATLDRASPEEIQQALATRGVFDRLLRENIDAGLLKPEDAIENYYGKVVDTHAVRESFGRSSLVRSKTWVTQRGIPGILNKIDQSQKLDPDLILQLGAPDEATVGWLLREKPTALLQGAAKGGWFELPGNVTSEEMGALSELFKNAEQWYVDPKSAAEMAVYGGRAQEMKTSALGLLKGLGRGTVDDPGQVFDPHLIARRPGTKFPTVDDPYEVITELEEKFLRKKWWGDYLEPTKAPKPPKVLSEGGKPLRMFHGTWSDQPLDPSVPHSKSLFFTQDPEYASSTYADVTDWHMATLPAFDGLPPVRPNVRPAYLSYRKMLDTTATLPKEEAAAVLREMASIYQSQVPPATEWLTSLRAETGNVDYGVGEAERAAQSLNRTADAVLKERGIGNQRLGLLVGGGRQDELQQAAKSLGYDMVKFKEPDSAHPSYAVFDPQNIHDGIAPPPSFPPEGTVTADSPFQQAIDSLHGFPNHQKLLTQHVRQMLGYPDPWDLVVSNATETLTNDPTTYKRFSGALRGLIYGGALGPPTKLATQVRNYFQTALNVPALGLQSTIDGVVEANRNWGKWMAKTASAGALDNQLSDELAVIERTQLPGTLGKFSELSQQVSEYLMAGQRYSETKNRVWTFTGTYVKALRQGKEFDASYLFKADAEKAKFLLDQAKTPEELDKAATWVAAQTTKQTMFNYGPAGQGPAFYGDTKKMLTMFSSWPVNYASLMLHWGSDERIQRVVNNAVTVALIDKLAYKHLGLQRVTGFTDRNDSSSSLPLGTGPMGLSISPPAQVLGGLAETGIGFGAAVASGGSEGAGAMREGAMRIKRNVPTFIPGGTMATRGYRSYQELKDDMMNRYYARQLGYTPPRHPEE